MTTTTVTHSPTGSTVLDQASYKPRKTVGQVLISVATWIIGLIFIAPVFFMALTSFHSEVNATLNVPKLLSGLTLSRYGEFFGASTGQSVWPFVRNSVVASVVSTVLVLCFAIPAAYALSVRPVKKWTDVMFFFLSTKFLPAAAGLVPLFIIAKQLGALNKIWFIIILYTAMNLPIAVWMMRSFLADIPVALFEAASLDGAGLFKTLIRIIAPIAMPGIVSTALICFIFSWNELFLVNILTTNSAAQTLPAFLPSVVTSQALFLGKLCAAATAVSLPVLIAGFAAQDKLVQGLSLGAVK
jgi:sorbitol/mannitol transport system permease protein